MRRLSFLIFVLLAGSQAAWAQGPSLAISYRNSASPAPVGVSNNGTITFPAAAAGSSSSITLTVGNSGTTSTAISALSVSGAGFSISGASATNLGAGGTTSYVVQFSSPAAGTYAGVLNFQATANSITTNYSFFLAASSTASNLVVSYIPPNGNQTPLTSGGTVAFPAAAVGQSVAVTVVITNRGDGAGTLSQAAVQGSGFQASGLPLLPAQIAPASELRFTLTFTAASRGAFPGTLKLTLDQADQTFVLSGQGVAAVWQYTVIINNQPTVIQAGAPTDLPPAKVGSTNPFSVQVRNAGDAPAQIGSIAATGSGFQLINPPALPQTLQPNDALTLNLTYSPQAVGTNSGTLTVGGASLAFNVTGIGGLVQVTYDFSGSPAQLGYNTTLTFPSTVVGQTSSATLQVTNAGNDTLAVNAINVTGTGFTLTKPPALPASLAPGGNVSFQITFTPNAVSTLTGTLQIDSFTAALQGAGSAPPAVPALTLTGLSGNSAALQQPTVSLSLAQPYSQDLAGTLTLSFTSDSFVDDPSIQFSSGGRTVSFRIPANTTDAVFGAAGKAVQFQSGSVAGTISLSVAVTTGGLDVTPHPAPSTTVRVQAGPPQLRSVQISNRTASSFDLVISGYATTRAVSQLQLQFTPSAGASLQTTSLTADVASAFSAWYQSAGSAAYGSQFTTVVTIGVAGNMTALQGVSVTASNGSGSSSSVSATF